MQETLTNFANRCFMADARKAEILEIFEPLGQYGVGTQSGCQAIALAVKTWCQSDDPAADIVFQSDITNAFGSFETMPALLSVHTHFPALFPVLTFGYGRDRVLLWPAKTAEGNSLTQFISQRGSAQGDVLSCLYYAFAVIGPLLETRAAYPGVGALL